MYPAIHGKIRMLKKGGLTRHRTNLVICLFIGLLLSTLIIGVILQLNRKDVYMHYSVHHSPSDFNSTHPSPFDLGSWKPQESYFTKQDTSQMIADHNENTTLKLPILMYHYVENVTDANDSLRIKLNVTPSEFEAQLETLKKEDYQSFWVKEIPDLTNKRIQLPEKSVVLTFDDGYRDFYEFAFPLLKKYQLKATVFIISDFIDHDDYLTSDQIKDMIESGLIEIGSHTLNHAYLKNAGSETAKKQIFESKANLEEEFNVQILSFAYPYGAFDEQSIRLLKEAGCLAAVSTVYGASQSNENLFYLSRMRATNYRGVNLAKALDML